jgi:hypothetical protein
VMTRSSDGTLDVSGAMPRAELRRWRVNQVGRRPIRADLGIR